MKKIILSERQSRELSRILNEEDIRVAQMPVDKGANEPYTIDPEKVKVVRKYLDNGFEHKDYEDVGPDGYPRISKIIVMKAANGEPLKAMYTNQLTDLLIDRFQDMFLDKIERELFMKQVTKDWLNGKISPFGLLSVNCLRKGKLNEITTDEITAEGENVNVNPTDKQKEAGNYRMGHISIKGMGISIENPQGSIRKGKDKNGSEWERTMRNHYGYFRNTRGNGKDGDAVDVFIGPHPEDFDKVYVVDQKVDGEFDESKVMLGFYSKDEARDAYRANYSSDWKGLWKITGVSLKTFKRWLYRDHKQRKPFFDYVTIKKHRIDESVINEEDYSEVVKVASMFDEKAATEVVEELKAKGIHSYKQGNDVYVIIDREGMSPADVDDIKVMAQRTARDYMQTHADSMEPAAATALMEEFDAINPLDMYNNFRSNPDRQRNHEEMAFDGWKRVRKGDKMNLVNVETDEYVSDEWFDWVGNMVDGIAIVSNRDLGYNLISDGGNLLLPEWHEDVIEGGGDNIYILIDGNTRQKVDMNPEKI